MVADFNLNRVKYVLIILFIPLFGLNAQSDREKGDAAFSKLKYKEAIVHYESFLKNKKDNIISVKLAEAYFLTGRYYDAETALKSLVDQPNAEGPLMLKYANVLLINGKVELAKETLKNYIKIRPSSDEYKKLFESANFEIKPNLEQYKYIIELPSFNSEVSDFSPMYYENKLVYTSQKGGKIDPWTGKSFANIFITDDAQKTAKQLEGNLNGKFHNGSVTFIGDQMIFTRNNSKKGSNDDYNLILAIAKKQGDKWNFDSEFPTNDKNYSNAYPAFSSKENVLIFSSDRPGGQGGMDLYYCTKSGQSWSTPINMGSKINTAGDEVFPFIDGTDLYFSSNGYPGLGGLDIFVTQFENKGSSTIKHLDAPLNSYRDDFGIITKDKLNTVYFSSNRNGNGEIDKIFSFRKEEIIQPATSIVISGKVIDEFTKIPLKETLVTLTNSKDGTSQTFMTKEDGRFSFDATSGMNYNLSGIKNDISTTKETIINTNIKDNYYYTLLHNDPRFSLEGFALNNKTQQGVAGVKVICFNKTKRTEETAITDDKGYFKFQLNQDSDFEISGTKDNYYTSVSEATTKGLNRSTTLYVKLYLSIEEVIIGETKILGKETFGGFDFDPVYYDFNKFDIRPDAALALDKVVVFLQKNPKLSIELGSHTDSRAKNDYNLSLSDKRAASAVSYIIGKGIDSFRITAKGYGETKLLNNCSDGIVCSEEDHQLNRRTEIKVLDSK